MTQASFVPSLWQPWGFVVLFPTASPDTIENTVSYYGNVNTHSLCKGICCASTKTMMHFVSL